VWWHQFVEMWNGVSMLSSLNCQAPAAVITSDASGSWGCGAFCEMEWFQLRWNDNLRHSHISVKELTPIVIAAAIWGRKWFGQSLLVRSYNIATVAIVNSGTSHNSKAMDLIRCLAFIAAKFQLSMPAVYLPGKENTIADAISRNNLSLFHSLYPQTPDRSSCSTGRPVDGIVPGLDLQSVNKAVERYFSTGLASGTKKTYQAGQRHYLSFCEQSAIAPLPASENTLCRFVAVLADKGIAHSTIKVYLSATH